MDGGGGVNRCATKGVKGLTLRTSRHRRGSSAGVPLTPDSITAGETQDADASRPLKVYFLPLLYFCVGFFVFWSF